MILSSLKNYTINFLGKKISEKIIVIESDDWGTVRMSSIEAFQNLIKKGYHVNQCPYNTNDALECNKDLETMFEFLGNVKGCDGKPAIITANNIVANPDFNKIQDSDFKEYHFETFTKTLKRYPEHDQVMDLYRQGINSGVVMPQFHGREHLNVTRWMNALKNNSKAEKDVFDCKVFSPKLTQSKGYTNEYMDALDFDNQNELQFQKKVIKEGLDLFEKIWGFRSESFIAPCYIWHTELEKTLATHGVKYLQGLVNQLQPKDVQGFKYRKIYHYQGQKNNQGQRYFIRNAFFEPTIKPNYDWESDCMKRIETAFLFKKPAIISSHRLNYIGFLNPSNRGVNLKRLKNLLLGIKKKWPEVQFMSTDQLGRLYDA
ncbi:hypothetical protein [Lunatibacter salilacus]|uniref:hypothetical protein n=1 Tax=Lunatibacter salilacus TaxID=2483804 RepID=UPI00131D9D6E|nr:hypothetical protein [Lunatibacter salilacus]